MNYGPFGRFLLTSAVMRSKPGGLLCRYLCMRYLISFGKKDLTESSSLSRALKVIFISASCLCFIYLQYLSMAKISQKM